MKESISLELKHVGIDYVDTAKISLMKNLFHHENKQSRIVHAVNDVSFSVKRGEIVGVVGKNGSGKTTLLRSIAGIFRPDRGVIDTKGNKVSLMAIGIGFNPNNTGRENVVKSGLLLGCSMEYIMEHMDEIIQFSELEDFIDKPVRMYSAGMYSKLSFAVTAVLETDIMLIDEVLSVGDEHFRKKSYEKMEELINSERTVLIVSHDIHTLDTFCDRVLWLNEGNIMKIGDKKEVLDEYKKYMN